MSRARHKKHHEHHRATGGKVVAYTAGDSNVMKEAHERKHGGRIHGEGKAAKHHAGKRKRGGRVHHHHEALGHGHHHGDHGHISGHVHKRARGGAVGSDKRPLSSAAKIKFLPEEHGGGHGAGPANEQTDH